MTNEEIKKVCEVEVALLIEQMHNIVELCNRNIANTKAYLENNDDYGLYAVSVVALSESVKESAFISITNLIDTKGKELEIIKKMIEEDQNKEGE